LSKNYRVIAVDPRSQGESDKPNYGYLPETRARDYKEFVDQFGLKQPVLVGWSMGCGELLSYVEQFGEDGISGLVLVDGLIPAKQNPEIVSVLSQWANQLQQDRQTINSECLSKESERCNAKGDRIFKQSGR
jgi:non-heme chloroperoxidase